MLARFTLRLLLAALLLASAAQSAAAFTPPYNQSKHVTLAVLWPADPVSGFNAVSLPISLALADIAAAAILPTTLAVSYTDSTTSGQVTAAAALAALADSTVIALLGTNDTANSVTVSQLSRAAAVTRPVFQTQSTATALTVSASVIRTSYVVSEYGAVFNLLLQHYNWSTFCLFHTIDADSRDIVSYMISSVVTPNVSMHTYAISNVDAAAAPAIVSSLDLVQQHQLRIVIVHGVQSLNILRAAAARDMLGAPMTWIGTDWCTQTAINTLLAEGIDLTGLLCIKGAKGAPASWAAFSQKLSTMDPVTFPDPSLVQLSAGYVYDAVWVLALAMQAQQKTNVSITLWNAAVAVNYTGVTGPLTFYGNGGDRVGQLGLYNYQPSTGLLIPVGNWSGPAGYHTDRHIRYRVVGRQYGPSPRPFRSVQPGRVADYGPRQPTGAAGLRHLCAGRVDVPHLAGAGHQRSSHAAPSQQPSRLDNVVHGRQERPKVLLCMAWLVCSGSHRLRAVLGMGSTGAGPAGHEHGCWLAVVG